MGELTERLRSLVGLRDIAVVLAGVGLLAFQMDNFADDPGLFGHLRTGQLLWEQGSLPAHDPFLAIEPAPRWIPDQWLAALIMYLLLAYGSWALIYALGWSVYLTGYFGLLAAVVRPSASAPLAQLAAILLAFRFGLIHFIARPLLVNFLFYPITLAAAYAIAVNRETKRSNFARWAPFLLIPLFVLWVNLHGAFVIGLLTLGCAVAAMIVEAILNRQAEGRSDCKRRLQAALLLLCLCTAATVINPFGLEIHGTIVSYTLNSSSKSLLEEWQPLNLVDNEGISFLFTVGLIACGAAINAARRLTVITIFELLLVVLLGFLTVKSVRILPFFGMAACRPMAVSLTLLSSEIATALPAASRLVRRLLSRINTYERRSLQGTVALVPLIIILPLYALLTNSLPFLTHPPGPRPERIPVTALETLRNWTIAPPEDLKALVPLGRPLVTAAHPNWGGAITYYGQGQLKPIIDDRDRMVGLGYYEEFFREINSDDSWYPYLRRHKVDIVLTGPTDRLTQKLRRSPFARQIYQDPNCLGFVLVAEPAAVIGTQ